MYNGYQSKKSLTEKIADFAFEKWYFLLLAVILIPLSFHIFMPAFGTNYSSGVREGVLQKYSVKGIIWKTGEGQLILPNFRIGKDGGGSEVFNFSDVQCRKFENLSNTTVKVYYTQALHRPLKDGETNYQVDSIVVSR
jgi:hypothetical protein